MSSRQSATTVALARDGTSPDPPLRPEIAVLLICARTSHGCAERLRLQELAHGDLDWELLIRAGLDHGMLPLLAFHFEAAGVPIANNPYLAQLYGYFRRNAARTLQLTGTLFKVLDLLSAHGITAVPYKGSSLAVRAYGNIALRQAGDLDIFISKADAVQARSLLLQNGFALRYPATPGNQAFRMANRYSEELVGPADVHLELHWAFANRDIPFRISMDDLAPRLGTVALGGSIVPEFSLEDLLLILSVHGAKHRWDRLEWIVGVAELLRTAEIDWSEVIARADQLRVRRTLFLSLLLAHDLLEAPLPPDVVQVVRSESWVEALAADVRARVFSIPGDENRGLDGVLSRNLFQFPLQETLPEKVRYLAYRLTTPNRPDSWQTVTIGERPLAVHAVTWPFKLAAKLATMPFRYPSKKR